MFDIHTHSITRESLPLLLSAKNVDKIGISRAMFYRLLHKAGVPTIIIGGRKYLNRDRFFEWLEKSTETIELSEQ